MRLVADTNLLVRAIVEDEPRQTRLAQSALVQAERVVLTVPALCELVWVLSRAYRLDGEDIAAALRGLLGGDHVEADHLAAEAGLQMLDAGGDFADGVIAYEGHRLGGDVFVSFDRRAVRLLTEQGISSKIPT